MRNNNALLSFKNKLTSKLYSIIIILLIAITSQAQTLIPQLWVTNGEVKAIASHGNTIYIGGSFSHVGPAISFGVPVHKNSGSPDLRFVMPDGGVDVAIPDGAGGWYIGGTFTSVGGQERSRLARINADGILHPWNPGANGFYVSCMLVHNNQLYIAGSFEEVAGQPRSQLASFDLATGELTPWHPEIDGLFINSIAIIGNTLYAHGGFWTFGGVARNGIGALDLTTGLATNWEPQTDFYGFIRALVAYGNTIIVGGEFTTMGGQPRMSLAALDAITGQATSWNPRVNGNVYTLTIHNNTLYIGGLFSAVGYRTRHNIASFNLNTGNLNSWKPQVNHEVFSIRENEGKIFIGGTFTSVNGVKRDRFAAFYTSNGNLASFKVPVNGTVTTIAFSSKQIYLGGYYSSIGGEERKNIAALDAKTGKLLPWNPGTNDYVYSLMIAHKKLFVGGSFDQVAGQVRNRLASFNLKNGHLTPWSPVVTGGPQGENGPGHVNKMAIYGNDIYYIGEFTKVNGQVRRGLAVVDATTGDLDPFYPIIQPPSQHSIFYDMALANGRLYLAGSFLHMLGQPRTGIASFDLSTGQLTPWSPVVPLGQFSNPLVYFITAWNNTVYLAGGFQEINGQPRSTIAAVDGITGNLKDWYPTDPSFFFNNLYSFVTNGENVFLGTTSIEDALMVLDAQTGERRNLNLQVMNTNGTADDATIYAIYPDGNRVYIGGDFSSVNNQPRPYFAGIDLQAKQPKLVFFNTHTEKHGNHTRVENNWTTKSDQQLSHFFVERSADNNNFTSIARIDALQNLRSLHFYEFTDPDPLPNTSYYRLRMVGRNNQEWFSSTNRVNIHNGCWVHIFPSPADHVATVHMKHFPGYKVNLVLHDQNGLLVWARANFPLNNGAGLIQIPVHGLMDGYYVLRISSGNVVESRAVLVRH